MPIKKNIASCWFDAQDLGRLEHQLLTSPIAVLEVDFLRDGAALLAARSAMTTAMAQQQKKKQPPLSATAAAASSDAQQFLRLQVERSGRADAVAVWFDLWLDEERGAHDVVSTRPERRVRGDASGWVRETDHFFCFFY